MAVKGHADRVVFYLLNDDKALATPPIVFSDFKDDSHFSFSIWVKVLDKTIGDVLFVYEGEEGSKLIIGFDSGGQYWYTHLRKEAVAIYASAILAPVLEGVYTAFCICKDGPNLIIYTGTEVAPNAEDTHVVLSEVMNVNPGFEFTFNHFAIVSRANWAICNLKYWNYPMNLGEFKEQIHYWNWIPRQGIGIPGENKYPIWSSTLRTPGDISNIANPNSGPNWGNSHAYSIITPDQVPLDFVADPAFMAKWTECPTWLYELSIRGTITAQRAQSIQNYPVIKGIIGTTPTIITDVLGNKYYEFQDRGSVPLNPTSFTGIEYYGYPSSIPPGKAQDATWGAYKDENGVDVAAKGSVYQFEPDTGVDIPPPGLGPDRMYLWKYGALFTWNPSVPTGAQAAIATLQYLFLYITFTGYPTAIPTPPVQDLAGLFAIKKGGKSVDRYNRGTELKIPDPTIRTAYIGE